MYGSAIHRCYPNADVSTIELEPSYKPASNNKYIIQYFYSAVMQFFLIVLLPLCFAEKNTITDEVYFDVKIEGKSNETFKGSFVVGLFGDALPMTAFNFISLAKGYKHREELWQYKNTQIHRIVPDFLMQMGDITYHDGRGGRSVYAPYFIDEGFVHSHRSAGYVAMANIGTDTNASQFYITLAKCRWLDSKNVVFGKVVKGMEFIRRLSELETDDYGAPTSTVMVTDSGIRPLKDPYDLSDEDLDKDTDIKPGPAAPDFVEL